MTAKRGTGRPPGPYSTNGVAADRLSAALDAARYGCDPLAGAGELSGGPGPDPTAYRAIPDPPEAGGSVRRRIARRPR